MAIVMIHGAATIGLSSLHQERALVDRDDDGAGHPAFLSPEEVFPQYSHVAAGLDRLSDGSDPFAAAVHVTRMPMIITNPRLDDNPIVFANDSFCRLSGYARDEVIGRNCRFLQGPDTDAQAISKVRAAIEAVEPIELELKNCRKDGSVFWNRLLIAPVKGHDGHVAYFFASQFDITLEREGLAARTRELEQTRERLRAEAAERERLEESFRQSRKMEAIGQLTGGIAHDFNNMLQAISGSLELIKRRIEQGRPDETGQFVDMAWTTVGRASALTNRLLAFARRQVLQPKPVVIDALVGDMVELFKRSIDDSIDLKLDLQDGNWTVLCDPSQLENSILNLIINARDAMPNGGQLTIGTIDSVLSDADVAGFDNAAPGHFVEVYVRDTGNGMDELTKARVFDPFFTTKPLGQGTGLGLSQIYGFVSQSGGVVSLESTVGQGTTVRIHLPRHEAVSSAAAVELPAIHAEDLVTSDIVLLVEDEMVVRVMAADQLRELGYSVLEAEDGATALLLLRSKTRVDILVTDVGLPGGMNGRQLAEAARETRPVLPVLFITGFAGRVLDQDLAPNMEVIGKPFALEVLATRIQSMMQTNHA